MKIINKNIKRMTIEQFAEKHNLTMLVHERHSGCDDNPLHRFYAYFANSDVSEGCVLVGKYGNGDSPKEAIKDYAKQISERTLVFNAYNKKERVEIRVPCLLDE